MCTPALLSNSAEGITESFAVGWCGVALAALLMYLNPPHRRAWGAVAAFALAASVWGGPYNGAWSAALCGAVGVAHARQWRRLVPVAALAWIGAAPVLGSLLLERVDGLPGTASRARWVRPILDATVFRGGNLAGADVLDLALPGFVTGGEAPAGHTAYLGVFAILLAISSVVRDRSRWPWLAGAGAFAIAAMGLHVTLGGRLVEVGSATLLAPVGLLAKGAPVLLRLTRWYRAAAVAGLLLAPLVALVPSRARWLAGLLLVADACLLTPRAWPVRHFDARPSPVWAALDAPGALVELPPVQWAFVPEGGIRDENLLQQTWHGRPNTGTFFNLSGGAASSREVSALMAVAIGKGRAGDAPERLAGLGYRYVIVDRTRFGGVPETALEATLGAPIIVDGHYVVYALPDVQETVSPDFPPWRSPAPPPIGEPGDGGPAMSGPGGHHQGGAP
jgi:hypothetical protein